MVKEERHSMTQQRLDQILAERQKLSEQMKPLYEALNQLQQQDKKLAIEMAGHLPTGEPELKESENIILQTEEMNE